MSLTEIVHGYVISSEGGERIARREVVWAKGRFLEAPRRVLARSAIGALPTPEDHRLVDCCAP
jgi:hypothetical protein